MGLLQGCNKIERHPLYDTNDCLREYIRKLTINIVLFIVNYRLQLYHNHMPHRRIRRPTRRPVSRENARDISFNVPVEPAEYNTDLFPDDNDWVRPPDEVVRETLIPTGMYSPPMYPIHDYPSETDIIQESWREYQAQQIEMEETFLANEKKERTLSFVQSKTQLERLMKIDQGEPAYAILLNYIAIYEEGMAEHFQVSIDDYHCLHKIISRIRIPEPERERFTRLICI